MLSMKPILEWWASRAKWFRSRRVPLARPPLLVQDPSNGQLPPPSCRRHLSRSSGRTSCLLVPLPVMRFIVAATAAFENNIIIINNNNDIIHFLNNNNNHNHHHDRTSAESGPM